MSSHRDEMEGLMLHQSKMRERIALGTGVSLVVFVEGLFSFLRERSPLFFRPRYAVSGLVLATSMLCTAHYGVQHETILCARRAMDVAFDYEMRAHEATSPRDTTVFPISEEQMRHERRIWLAEAQALCREGGEFMLLPLLRRIWNDAPFSQKKSESRLWHYEYSYGCVPSKMSIPFQEPWKVPTRTTIAGPATDVVQMLPL